MLNKLKYAVSILGLTASTVLAHDLNIFDDLLPCDREIKVKIVVASAAATVRVMEEREPSKADVIHMLIHVAAEEGWDHGKLLDHLLFVDWAIEFKDGDEIKSACE